MTGVKYFSSFAALSVVMANMIGTGVFTSLGFQLQTISSPFALIMLWVVGGVAALCGALSYAELGAALPRSGGEYNFLACIYHPGAGFVSGFISSTIGFSAPVALAAMTFGAYTSSVMGEAAPSWLPRLLAAFLIIVLTFIHAGKRQSSGGLQTIFTILKILIIIIFCIGAVLLVPERQAVSFLPEIADGPILLSAGFAISLIYVSYAYTGWNAATYLSGEIENPQQQLPRILFFGTLAVMLLYVALNAVFLLVAPQAEMIGKLEVGYIAAEAVFGATGAKLTGLVLATLLISTVSAMTIAGPRVLQIIGEDYPFFKILGKSNEDGIPSRAIYAQSAIALLFVLSSTFDKVLIFAGFTLALNSFLAVFGLFLLRWREPALPRPFRVPLFPLVPLLYLLLTSWTLVFVLAQRPIEGGLGLLLIGIGTGVYLATRQKQPV